MVEKLGKLSQIRKGKGRLGTQKRDETEDDFEDEKEDDFEKDECEKGDISRGVRPSDSPVVPRPRTQLKLFSYTALQCHTKIIWDTEK